jgi:hypothetical protein
MFVATFLAFDRASAADAATPDTSPMRLSSLPLALAVAMAASAAAAQLQKLESARDHARRLQDGLPAEE